MKKFFIAPLALAFAFALTLSPAFASDRRGDCCRDNNRDRCCPSIEVDNENDSHVLNVTASVSNTGKNYISGTTNGNHSSPSIFSRHSNNNHREEGSEIETGDAYADAYSTTGVGSNDVTVRAPRSGSVDIENDNDSHVANFTVAVANTGKNAIRGGGEIETGAATSWSNSALFVGTNVVRIK